MQFMDIAVASGYAAVCLSLLLIINPVAPREAAVDAAARSAQYAAISEYVSRVGLPFLTTAPAAAVCASAVEASNSTFTFDASIAGVDCAAPPTSPLSSSSLTLELPGRTLVVEAWLARR